MGIVITIPYRLNENQIREIETVFNTLKKAKYYLQLNYKNKKQSSLPLYFLEKGDCIKEHKRSKKSQNLNLKDFKQGLINKIINRHVDLEDLL